MVMKPECSLKVPKLQSCSEVERGRVTMLTICDTQLLLVPLHCRRLPLHCSAALFSCSSMKILWAPQCISVSGAVVGDLKRHANCGQSTAGKGLSKHQSCRRRRRQRASPPHPPPGNAPWTTIGCHTTPRDPSRQTPTLRWKPPRRASQTLRRLARFAAAGRWCSCAATRTRPSGHMTSSSSFLGTLTSLEREGGRH
jgi:hypothetical protein